MKLNYANKLIDNYHEAFGDNQPNQNMNIPECYRMMHAWNKNNNASITWAQYNKYYHVTNNWRKPSDGGRRGCGWHAWDSEILARGCDWWTVNVEHITKDHWIEALAELKKITGLEPEVSGPILMAILKYQVGPGITPTPQNKINYIEQLLRDEFGIDTQLMESRGDTADIKGADLISDDNWAKDTGIVVQLKADYGTWLKHAKNHGTPQSRQYQAYCALAADYRLFIYDESKAELIEW